ncbi:CPBP family glutamic-type intramembrane protease [Clostridium sp.]|uniref:CPBP family glutamic-type intramembrane protease n=1 Tax=Clostridium sp. TaxID=1506 RepID=UPI0034A4AEE4
MDIIKKLDKIFLNLKIHNFIIIIILLGISNFLFNLLPNLLFKNVYVNNFNSPTSIILNSIFLQIYTISIGPFLETFIFQFLIIKICKNLFKNYTVGFILSIILFSLFHNYSLEYIFSVLPAAIFFAYIFILYDKYKMNPLIRLTFIHSVFNLIPLLVIKFII